MRLRTIWQDLSGTWRASGYGSCQHVGGNQLYAGGGDAGWSWDGLGMDALGAIAPPWLDMAWPVPWLEGL